MRTPDSIKEEQTRAEIVLAAQQIFQKYGLEKSTMEDIAVAAGKGKSSLYYYFPSKNDVFYAVAKKESDEVESSIEMAISRQTSPSAKLKALVLTHYYELRLKINLYPVMLTETGKHFELFRKIQRENNTKEVERLKGILLEGIRCGEFKSIKEEDCQSLAFSVMMMLRGLCANIVIAGELPPEELRTDMPIDVFIRGLR